LAKGFNVVAFEADPDHAAHCRSRFAEAIRTQRLTIVEGAIAPPTESGRVTFYKNLGNTFQGTISDEWATRLRRRHKESLAIEVPRIDIAGQFRAFGIPHYLKIDIEGADKLVLEALAAFPDRPPYLSFESEKLEFARLVEELDLLRALGYMKFRAVQQKYICGITVETKDRLGKPARIYVREWRVRYLRRGHRRMAELRRVPRRLSRHLQDLPLVRGRIADQQDAGRAPAQIHSAPYAVRESPAGLVRHARGAGMILTISPILLQIPWRTSVS
jgi:FkbM family methyltransferase